MFYDKNKPNGTVIIKVPELNLVSKAEIGENIYKKYNQKLKNSYEVDSQGGTKAVLANGDSINTFNAYSGKVNKKYLYKWEDANNAICYPVTGLSSYICLVDIDNSGSFSVAAYNTHSKTYPLSNRVSYTTRLSEPTLSEDSFKYIALYQGKVGSKIKISFREFHSNMARPAFTQNIEYELEKDGTAIVGFKGLRIKVSKATNMDITYSVIKDYN